MDGCVHCGREEATNCRYLSQPWHHSLSHIGDLFPRTCPYLVSKKVSVCLVNCADNVWLSKERAYEIPRLGHKTIIYNDGRLTPMATGPSKIQPNKGYLLCRTSFIYQGEKVELTNKLFYSCGASNLSFNEYIPEYSLQFSNKNKNDRMIRYN